MKSDDPRLTAYLLGELDGPEREAVENALAQDPQLENTMNEIHRVVNQLETDRPAENGLTPEQIAAVKASAHKNRSSRRSVSRYAVISIGLSAAAACLILVLAPNPTSQPEHATSTVESSRPERVRAEDTAESTSGAVAEVTNVELARVEGAKFVAARVSDAPASPINESREIKSKEVTVQAAPGEPSVVAQSAAASESHSRTWSRLRGTGSGSGISSSISSSREISLLELPVDEFNTEAYAVIEPNAFRSAIDHPLSTFSIDVDTASYSNVRRFLAEDRRPPEGAVRTEELINYFTYDLPQPEAGAPFSISTDVTLAPWNQEHLLVRIALKGREIPRENLPPSNLVFLLDVSGSMRSADKLPLVQKSMKELLSQLGEEDSVAIVTYAGSSGLVLAPTSASEVGKITAAIDNLRAGGSTAGASGIRLAYEQARKSFLPDGNNRVILCTDGDFNVGTTSQSELVDLIEKERKSGVFLTVLGFGTGNLKDSTMELLADKGNGNYAYIDSISEARKTLVQQAGSTLHTIAKDVKIQVEFNPTTVAGYRLIGYESRLLAKEDFNNDKIDAGEIGSGHAVTALYEIVPAGEPVPGSPSVDPLKYQPVERDVPETAASASADLFTVKLRYKEPDGEQSKLIERAVETEPVPFEKASVDVRFAAAVAAFSAKLRGEDTSLSWDEIRGIARESLGQDPGSLRVEFIGLTEKAEHLPAQ